MARNVSWFYFRITGLPLNMKLTFEARKLHILHRIYRNGHDMYRPVIKIGEQGKWHKIKERPVQDINENKELFAMFPITIDFDNNKKFIEIAFCFPYKYEEMMNDVSNFEKQFESHDQIYFHKEILCKSVEGLSIPLQTISSHHLKLDTTETYTISDGQPTQCLKFCDKKPVIIFSGRVHPGETPASIALNGAIKFLLKANDEDAKILRKNFVFKIVPILNPDGVYHGHFRKDRNQLNQNRFYKNPLAKKHPTCLGLKSIMDYFSENHRQIFFTDFHAHSGLRNCFVYGNHCNFVRQVEARLFVKIQSNISNAFSYLDSDFSVYQMKCKEKNEMFGKEGCARVMGYYTGGLAHSYTLEMTYHSIIDQDTKMEIEPLELDDMEKVGENFCMSIIYQFGIRKFYLIENKQEKIDLAGMRTEIANSIKKIFLEHESHMDEQIRNINRLVEDMYYKKIFDQQIEFLRENNKDLYIINNNNGNKKGSYHHRRELTRQQQERTPAEEINRERLAGKSFKDKQLNKTNYTAEQQAHDEQDEGQLQKDKMQTHINAHIMMEKLTEQQHAIQQNGKKPSQYQNYNYQNYLHNLYHQQGNKQVLININNKTDEDSMKYFNRMSTDNLCNFYNNDKKSYKTSKDYKDKANNYREKMKEIDLLEKAHRELYEKDLALKHKTNDNNYLLNSQTIGESIDNFLKDQILSDTNSISRSNRFIDPVKQGFQRKGSANNMLGAGDRRDSNKEGSIFSNGQSSNNRPSYGNPQGNGVNYFGSYSSKMAQDFAFGGPAGISQYGKKMQDINQNINNVFQKFWNKKTGAISNLNNVTIDDNTLHYLRDLIQLNKHKEGNKSMKDFKSKTNEHQQHLTAGAIQSRNLEENERDNLTNRYKHEIKDICADFNINLDKLLSRENREEASTNNQRRFTTQAGSKCSGDLKLQQNDVFSDKKLLSEFEAIKKMDSNTYSDQVINFKKSNKDHSMFLSKDSLSKNVSDFQGISGTKNDPQCKDFLGKKIGAKEINEETHNHFILKRGFMLNSNKKQVKNSNFQQQNSEKNLQNNQYNSQIQQQPLQQNPNKTVIFF